MENGNEKQEDALPVYCPGAECADTFWVRKPVLYREGFSMGRAGDMEDNKSGYQAALQPEGWNA